MVSCMGLWAWKVLCELARLPSIVAVRKKNANIIVVITALLWYLGKKVGRGMGTMKNQLQSKLLNLFIIIQ